MPRNFNHAYFEDEQGSRAPSDNLFFNKYKQPGCLGINIHVDLKNFLDPSVRTQRQPVFIPQASQGQRRGYDLYVGSKTKKKVEDARRANVRLPELKVSLLFGVGQDLDNLGLRHFFEQVDDRILINIPGNEGRRYDIDDRKRTNVAGWNFGISGLKDAGRGIDTNQVEDLLTAAGLHDVQYKIVTLAAYSTGYGGLNQTVNEGLIPLKDIETAVYYDCTYRADTPRAAPGDPPLKLTAAETNSGPDEIDTGHIGSAFNTQRARTRIADSTSHKATIVAYMATLGGSPMYKPSTSSGNQYVVDFPTKIDLRSPAPSSPVTFVESLFSLVLTRCLAYAQVEGQVNPTEVPAPFKDLARVLPRRGQVASTTANLKTKQGFAPTTTLLDWGKTNAAKVKEAQKHVGKAISLISRRELMYPKDPGEEFSYPSPGNEAGALHAGLLPEFGWEFLL